MDLKDIQSRIGSVPFRHIHVVVDKLEDVDKDYKAKKESVIQIVSTNGELEEKIHKQQVDTGTIVAVGRFCYNEYAEDDLLDNVDLESLIGERVVYRKGAGYSFYPKGVDKDDPDAPLIRCIKDTDITQFDNKIEFMEI